MGGSVVSIDSCGFGDDGSGIYATTSWTNWSNASIDLCAHLPYFGTETWVPGGDFGCRGWTNDSSEVDQQIGKTINVPNGTYNVSVGFRSGGDYYGDVQNPETWKY
ncbi:hypothetical protein P3T37_007329 [Kitasatospora sp. MAA4]|uniref:hypothetical protein n=1 Tax=Kitasatospora sp. MAA4 TaxID=3035093 RepID=UPI0024760464|nr:hypothetical protein [Kitasatospora sp. MAA4]MDH6137891.1 hypothetical protein [Kitasatospora sp. MAA4]